MPKKKLGGSISIAAMIAALEELEEQMEGRVADDQVEELFGARVARLREKGILTEAIILAYARKAAEEDRAGLVDETAQARLILSRYDERRGSGRRKPSGPQQQAPGQTPDVDGDDGQSGLEPRGWLTRPVEVEAGEGNGEAEALDDEVQIAEGVSTSLTDEPV